MTVYLITPKNEEYKGEALVAANNAKEALETFKISDEFNDTYFNDMNLDCEVIPELTYNSDISKIIIDYIRI